LIVADPGDDDADRRTVGHRRVHADRLSPGTFQRIDEQNVIDTLTDQETSGSIIASAAYGVRRPTVSVHAAC